DLSPLTLCRPPTSTVFPYTTLFRSKIYQLICRRFLSIFYPPAVYQKYTLELERKVEHFFGNFKVLLEPGYLKAADVNYGKKDSRSEEHTSELQSRFDLVCRLLLEKK